MSTIWFACKKCARKHSRPESSAGTFVFCDCGEGMAVPWESTIEAPPVPDMPSIPVPPPPRPTPAPPRSSIPPRSDPYPMRDDPQSPGRPPRPSRRPLPRRRDPRFCLNHEEAPSQRPCADCQEAFCSACLVEFQGATLCGPCKNFRARTLQSPPRLSGKALSSVLVAIPAGVLGLCLLPLNERGGGWISLLALLPQLIALALGVWALRDIEVARRGGGRSLAITGVLTGAVACVATVLVTFFAPVQLW